MNAFLNVLYEFFLGWVINVPGRIGHYLRYSYYKRQLKHLGKHVILDQGVIIVSPEKVVVGNHVWIDKNTQILGGEGVTIGDHVHIAQNVLVQGVGQVEIQDYASLAAGVFVISGTEDFFEGKHINPMTPRQNRCRIIKRKVVIGKAAVVALNSVVLPGVTVGEGAIVGALSLANKDVPAWTVVAGCPAKPFKDRMKIEVMP